MILSILVAFHILGLALWLGGLWGTSRVLEMRHDLPGVPSEALAGIEHELLYRLVHPGMGLALVCGAALFSWAPKHYLGEGWMIAKLFLAALLIAVTLWIIKARRGPEGGVSPKSLQFARGFAVFIATVALLLATVRPF
ncbi:MAG: hypothetical protein AUJ52_07085 [Elusimicrobia bacterium CG1_02_63_36]|nr:MAG: hypothetical protein AUJ52_07085 [Elusimicrobia bacterium CG1_02_63_36]PIP81758.1 MAG: hypothetical protein COR54_18540 [Elusimicrobia bacterium CG22_combo_CG10-13_8_21_14_all_63_91]PJB23891.1 MAG: hypothetical protein CO113_16325 [Elusimicrobia bacterium CG_4_9_14_3_um_filter_62_55]